MKVLKQKKIWWICAAAACLAAVLIAMDQDPSAAAPSPSQPIGTQGETTPSGSVVPEETRGVELLELEEGIVISDFGPYSGIFMEDGTNDAVSDVMMLLLRNDTKKDLQYIKFSVTAGETVYAFEATNIPAGERAVLLDLERKQATQDGVTSAEAAYTVFFEEPMETCEDAIEIGGLDGALNVRNVSGGDIDGDIHVYYKYASEDVFYGGITFRAVISGGLDADELRQIPTGHFQPELCRIVQVTYGH